MLTTSLHTACTLLSQQSRKVLRLATRYCGIAFDCNQMTRYLATKNGYLSVKDLCILYLRRAAVFEVGSVGLPGYSMALKCATPVVTTALTELRFGS